MRDDFHMYYLVSLSFLFIMSCFYLVQHSARPFIYQIILYMYTVGILTNSPVSGFVHA